MEVTIERTKIYNRRPGRFAWHYGYTVRIPGEPHPFGGTSLSWANDLIKRKAPGATVKRLWH